MSRHIFGAMVIDCYLISCQCSSRSCMARASDAMCMAHACSVFSTWPLPYSCIPYTFSYNVRSFCLLLRCCRRCAPFLPVRWTRSPCRRVVGMRDIAAFDGFLLFRLLGRDPLALSGCSRSKVGVVKATACSGGRKT